MRRFVLVISHFRGVSHAELVSATHHKVSFAVRFARGLLKQVQHDLSNKAND